MYWVTYEDTELNEFVQLDFDYYSQANNAFHALQHVPYYINVEMGKRNVDQ